MRAQPDYTVDQIDCGCVVRAERANLLSVGWAMLIRNAGRLVGKIFFQRCFYLFLVLMLFLGAVPFIEATPFGRFATNCVNTFIIVAAVASVGRTTVSFAVAILLAGPALTYQWISVTGSDPHAIAVSWGFGALLYATTVAYLLRYVFRREVMTADKLFGAASAYLLIGFFWAFLYALIAHFYSGSFALFGSRTPISFYDFVYFSFTVLTSTLVVHQAGGIRYVAFSVAMLLVLQAPIIFGFGIETRSRALEVIEEQPNSLEPAVAQLSRR